jgi:PPOX class probable F420-dependent enzyme
MADFPEKYLDLANQKAAYASLATLMDDGTPQVTPVWFDYTDGEIRVNTATGRVKAKNMVEGAPVALAILDPDNPYRYVQIRGHVTRTTLDGADDHIESLSHKYLGKPYPFRKPGEERIKVEISIDKASASG